MHSPLHTQLKPLYSSSTIAMRVKELGIEIAQALPNEPLVVIGVLKGSFIFLADLVRTIPLSLTVDFIGVSSYEGTSSTGEVRITSDLTAEIANKNVLLVEDIVDTGTTLDFLLTTLAVRKPKQLKVVALLSKPASHNMQHKVDFTGFEVSNEFVIGYGLDFNGEFRQLPDLMQMIPSKP